VNIKPNIVVALVKGEDEASLSAQILSCGLGALSEAMVRGSGEESTLFFGCAGAEIKNPVLPCIRAHQHAPLAWITDQVIGGSKVVLGAVTPDTDFTEILESYDENNWQVDFTFCAPDFDIDEAADILATMLKLADFNSEREQKKLRVVALEALTNAWEHGYGGDKAKRIHVNYRVNRDGMHIEVSHHGLGFDVGDVPDPLAPENLLSDSGRGILIMKNTLDRFEYQDGGRRLLGYKRFTKQ